MPRRKSTLPPPFTLPGYAVNTWLDLQQELGGIRGKGYTTAQIWKLATTAQHQAQFKRGEIDAAMLANLKRTRAAFGLPEIPPA